MRKGMESTPLTHDENSRHALRRAASREEVRHERCARRLRRAEESSRHPHGGRLSNRDGRRRCWLLGQAAFGCRQLQEQRRARGLQRAEHGGQVQARGGGVEAVRRHRPRHADDRPRGVQNARVSCHDRVRERHLHHGRRAHARPRARDSSRRREAGARRHPVG